MLHPAGDLEIFNDNLTAFLDKTPLDRKIIFCANFNIDFFKESLNTKDLKNVYLSFSIHECISDFTRITSTSPTRIDNVFSNIDNFYYETKIYNPCLSDHECLSFSYRESNVIDSYNEHQSYRLINNVTIENYKLSISNCNWSDFFETRNVNQITEILIQ